MLNHFPTTRLHDPRHPNTGQQVLKGYPILPDWNHWSSPPGTGSWVAALQKGQLNNLLTSGAAIFEGSDRLIRGILGNY